MNWNGKLLTVSALYVPRYLWATASISVYLNEECILRTGGQLRFTGSCSTQYSDANGTHIAELSWGLGFLRSFPYTLRIDNVHVVSARVHVKNWPVALTVWWLLALVALVIRYVIHVWRA